VSVLRGEDGYQRKEIDKLIEWVREERAPDLVNLPNSLLIALAAPLRRALARPICCTLQGEDVFLEGLPEPWRSEAIALIRQKAADVDAFISVSDYYVEAMASYLRIPGDRIAVVPLGINLRGYDDAMERELVDQLKDHADSQGYVFTGPVQIDFEAAGIDPKLRPENLSPEDYARLSMNSIL